MEPAAGTAAAVEPAAGAAESPELGNPLPSDAMVQGSLAQAVVDHPHVSPFLHPEARTPFRVHAVAELAEGMSALRVAGAAVVVVDTADAAHLRFVARQHPAGSATQIIHFEIPDEGVAGFIEFELRDYAWVAVRDSVVER